MEHSINKKKRRGGVLAGDWAVPLHWVSGKGFSEAGANHRKILWKSIPGRAFGTLPNITPTTFSFHSAPPSGALLISHIQPLLVSNMPCGLLFPCLHVLFSVWNGLCLSICQTHTILRPFKALWRQTFCIPRTWGCAYWHITGTQGTSHLLRCPPLYQPPLLVTII